MQGYLSKVKLDNPLFCFKVELNTIRNNFIETFRMYNYIQIEFYFS